MNSCPLCLYSYKIGVMKGLLAEGSGDFASVQELATLSSYNAGHKCLCNFIWIEMMLTEFALYTLEI